MFVVINMVLQGSKAAAVSIYSNGRSLLTTLGIIGVAAVITVVAVMNGLSASVGNQLDDFASDMVTLRAKTSEKQELLGQKSTLNYDDYLWLKHKANFIQDVAPTMQPNGFATD